MRIIALMSAFAESPTWIAASIASLSRIGCEHVVFVDGAFQHFPDGTASSGAESHEAVIKTTEALGMGLTLHVPQKTWEGNEIEKTSFRFDLGNVIATSEEDWFFVLDLDSVIVEAPPTVREDLAATPCDVATVSLADYIDWHSKPGMEDLGRSAFIPARTVSPLRCFFRAIPGLWCEGTHAHWFAERDGRRLFLRGSDDQQLEPSLDLGHVVVEHRARLRTQEREARKKEFYRRRDAFNLEPGFKAGPPPREAPRSDEVKA